MDSSGPHTHTENTKISRTRNTVYLEIKQKERDKTTNDIQYNWQMNN